VAVEYPPLFEREKVDGLRVVKDEVLASGLSGYVGKVVPLHGTRVLTLEDDSVTYGCRDCEFTGTRGEVKTHRGAEHGVATGGGGAAKASAAAGRISMPSPEMLGMTLWELLEYASIMGEWEDVLPRLETRVRELTEERDEENRARRAAERALATLKTRIQKQLGV
jgi:hypothetical protein